MILAAHRISYMGYFAYQMKSFFEKKKIRKYLIEFW